MSKREWRVRLDKSALVIEPTSVPLPPRQATPKFDIPFIPPEFPRGPPCDDCILRVDDGWFVGYNFGEWGGRLWWTDPQGRNTYPVTYAGYCPEASGKRQKAFATPGGDVSNIVAVERAAGGVFVFEGLAHLGPSVGELLRASRQKGRWEACYLTDLEGAPQAILADAPDAWFVLAAGGFAYPSSEKPPPWREGTLLRVTAKGTRTLLGTPAFMSADGVYPNSMVKLDDGTLYVGMRHFVARFLPNGQHGYREELLIPNDRPAFDFEPSIDAPSAHGPSFPNCSRPR
jgi:hypothetical protein